MYALGKLPAKRDPRIPMLRDLVEMPDQILIDVPLLYRRVPSWPMLKNNTIGLCTIASALHQVQFWSAANGEMIMPTAQCAIDGYARATGYNPVTGQHDDGAYEQDILKFWMHSGLTINEDAALDRLDGYAAISPGDIKAILNALLIFGTVYVGVELPTSAQGEFEKGVPWASLVAAPGSWGGHAVPLVWGNNQRFLCVTWGMLQSMTIDWWLQYGSEAYVPLNFTWLNRRTLVSPSGLDIKQLEERVANLRGELAYAA